MSYIIAGHHANRYPTTTNGYVFYGEEEGWLPATLGCQPWEYPEQEATRHDFLPYLPELHFVIEDEKIFHIHDQTGIEWPQVGMGIWQFTHEDVIRVSVGMPWSGFDHPEDGPVWYTAIKGNLTELTDPYNLYPPTTA